MPDESRLQYNLPTELLKIITTLPPRMTRRRAAEELERHLGVVTSYRTLEKWPLPVQHVCGKALIPTLRLFEVGHSKLVDAPVVMGGRSSAPNKVA